MGRCLHPTQYVTYTMSHYPTASKVGIRKAHAMTQAYPSTTVQKQMKPWATHIPVLVRCLEYTSGPILEFGIGVFSTPVISSFAWAGRYARSYEADQGWFNLIRSLGLSDAVNHEIIKVGYYPEVTVHDLRWSVCFIDNSSADRAENLRITRPYGDLFIVHDTDQNSFACKELLGSFKYRWDSDALPQTTVVSDNTPLDFLRELPRSNFREVASLIATPTFEGTIESGGYRITKTRIP